MRNKKLITILLVLFLTNINLEAQDWTIINPGVPYYEIMWSVYFVDPNVGFISTGNGKIFKTVDQGNY